MNGDRTIIPFNNNSTGKTVAFNGDIGGTSISTIRFNARQGGISGITTELNGVNTNAVAGSQMVFQGSNDDGSGLGNTYVIGNSAALGWDRIILGEASTTSDEVAFLYKDGVDIANAIELNEADPGRVTMGVTGTGAAATQSGGIILGNFGLDLSKDYQITAGSDSTFTVSGTITTADAGDTLNVTKIGDGTVALTSATGNDYRGTTTISAGTLLVNNTTNSGTGTGAVIVASGATFAGSNLIAPTADNDVTVNGTLAPGALDNGAGRMEFDLSGASKLAFGGGSVLAFDLGTTSDLIDFTLAGDWLTGSGDATLALTLGAGFDYSLTYTVFSDVTTTGFTFAAITGYDTANFDADFAKIGNDYRVSFTAVPEPSPAMLGACGLLILLGVARARRRSRMA